MSIAAPHFPTGLKLLAHELRWEILRLLSASDHNGNELLAKLGGSQNLLSYHLAKLKEHGLVRESRSIADGREMYYSADTGALQALLITTSKNLHPALAPESDQAAGQELQSAEPVKVLFLCTHNSARSQMAEGLLRDKAAGLVQVYSAGTEPSEVNPLAIEALERMNIDIRGQQSKPLTEYLEDEFDYVITVCDRAKESCPVFPGTPEQIHWSFPDPAVVEGSHEDKLRAFHNTALELSQRINFLVTGIRRRSETSK